MSYVLKTATVQAFFIEDKENNIFTVTSIEVGGPIVSALTLKEAQEKFEKALKLSAAVKNLMYFKGISQARSAVTRKQFIDNAKETINNVEYHQLAV